MRGPHEPLRLVVEARLPARRRQRLDERSGDAGQWREPVCHEVGGIRVVAAEQLVPAFARERDLDVLRGKLRDEVGRQRRRVCERLVEGVGERLQQQLRVRPYEQLVVLGAVPLGDQARVGALVEAPLCETDRERVHRLRRLLSRERCKRRRVDAAGEEDADRDVREEMCPHRVAKPRPELLDELRLVAVAQLGGHRRAGPRVPLERDRAVLPDEHVPGGQLPDVAEDRVRRGDRVEGEERLEGVEVDLAARQRPHLRREAELVADVAVVERLDPVAVAREYEPTPPRVPDRDREHPAQPLGEAGPVVLVEMDERLGVAASAQLVPRALQLAAELGVVVDLAVLDDDAGSVLVRDRLVAVLEVDDRETPGCKRDAVAHVLAAAVRAAVDELLRHRTQRVEVRAAARRRDPADPAHGPTLGGAAHESSE